MKPVLSVVIPTYGRHEQLERAVRTVMTQECDVPFEVVVVDDNPADSELRQRNAAMLAQFQPVVRHLSNSGRRGGAGARNTGIEAATGEWIAFLDDDDEWLPNKLRQQLTLMRNAAPQLACIDTGFYEDDEATGRRKSVMPQLQGDIFDTLLVKHQGRAPKLSTLICRREALVSIGMFDPELPSRQDLDLYLRLARHYRFASVAEPLAIKHVHTGARISTSHANKIRGFELYYRKYRDDFLVRPELHRIFLRQYARWLYRAKRYPAAVRLLLRSLWP